MLKKENNLTTSTTMKFDRKPPLAKSPIILRPRRVLRPNNAASVQTPPGSLTKSQKLNPTRDTDASDLQPEYRSISCELRALARMVENEFGNGKGTSSVTGLTYDLSGNSSLQFERGRFYEVYSARRNERLKRKKGENGEEVKTQYNLGVTIDSSKKRDSKKLESLMKSVSAAYSVERGENPTPRYSLRSLSKEKRKPPLAVNSAKSAIASERKVGVRRVGRI